MACEHLDLPLERVAALGVVAVVRRRERVQGRLRAARGVVLRLCEGVPQLQDLLEPREERLHHGPLRGHLVRLPEVGDLRAATHDRRALVGRELLADEAQERRFSGPVGRDERGLLPRVEGERHPLKELVRAVPEPEVGDTKQRHGGGI